MNIDYYEKIWMWAAALVVLMFMAFVGVSTFAQGIHPPSHVETIAQDTDRVTLGSVMSQTPDQPCCGSF